MLTHAYGRISSTAVRLPDHRVPRRDDLHLARRRVHVHDRVWAGGRESEQHRAVCVDEYLAGRVSLSLLLFFCYPVLFCDAIHSAPIVLRSARVAALSRPVPPVLRQTLTPLRPRC